MKNKIALKKFIDFTPDAFQDYVSKKVKSGEVELDEPYIKRISVPDQYNIFENEERVLLATTSKIGGVDRDNEIVLTENIDLEAYKLNPVLMLNHDWNDLPIGHAVLSVTTVDRLRQKFLFDEDERSITTFRKYQSKSLRAFSAGFLPKRVIKNGSKEFGIIADHLMMLGLVSKADIDKTQRILQSSILLETSSVSIPANEKALMEAVSADNIPNTPIIINDINKDRFQAEIPIERQQDPSHKIELQFPGKRLGEVPIKKDVDGDVIENEDGVEDTNEEIQTSEETQFEDSDLFVEDEVDTEIESEMDDKTEVEGSITSTEPQVKTVIKLLKKATPVVYRELTKEDVHEILMEEIYRMRGGI